jgi:hypothetical protein
MILLAAAVLRYRSVRGGASHTVLDSVNDVDLQGGQVEEIADFLVCRL